VVTTAPDLWTVTYQDGSKIAVEKIPGDTEGDALKNFIKKGIRYKKIVSISR
jgi:hypothetical protein